MSVPLVVWDQHITCDGCGDEVRVTTDGRKLYAVAAHGDTLAFVERVDSELTFYCPNMVRMSWGDGDDCGAVLVADLASEHWTADVKLRTLVAEHGTEVQVR